MFTEGTKHFGTWRVGHPSLNRHTGRPTQAILLAYGFCAFLTWLIFILTLKIRGEFFLIEGLNLPLHESSFQSAQPLSVKPVGLSVAVRAVRESGKARVIFDTGESFLIPDEKPLMTVFLEKRAEQMELSAMLRKKISPGMSSAILWVDKNVPLESVQPFAKSLVNVGFDTLHYAVAGQQKNRQMEAQ